MSYRSKPRTVTDHLSLGPRGSGTNEVERANVLFEVLSHEHRRAALRHLVDQDEAIPLEDLQSVVTDTAEWPPETTRIERESRVAAGFHHTHIGKLRDADMIVYDPELETIRATDNAVLAAHILNGL